MHGGHITDRHLAGVGHEADAGLGVVHLDGAGNDAALVLGEPAGDEVGDGGVRPLLPQLPDSILAATVSYPQYKHYMY